jgi:hypothetical protein
MVDQTSGRRGCLPPGDRVSRGEGASNPEHARNEARRQLAEPAVEHRERSKFRDRRGEQSAPAAPVQTRHTGEAHPDPLEHPRTMGAAGSLELERSPGEPA